MESLPLKRHDAIGVGILDAIGVGCRFTKALIYADDITLLASCEFWLVFREKYASEFDIIFLVNCNVKQKMIVKTNKKV